MSYESRLFVVVCLAVSLGMLLVGCNATTPDGGDTTATGDTYLSDHNHALLEAAKQAYTECADSNGVEAARVQTVLRLRATGGVKGAGLLEDGTTIFIEYEDGQRSMLITRRFTAPGENPPVSAESTLRATPKIAGASTAIAKQIVQADAPTGDHVVPLSRKVRMLDIIHPLAPWSDNSFDNLEEYLREYGWEDDDLDISIRRYIPPPPPPATDGFSWKRIEEESDVSAKFADDEVFTPDSLFDLADYGVVLIYTHGVYGDPTAAVAQTDDELAEEVGLEDDYLPPPLPPVTETLSWRVITPKIAQATSAGNAEPHLYLMCGPNMELGEETMPEESTYIPPAPPPAIDTFVWRTRESKVDAQRYAQYEQWFADGKLIVASYTEDGWENRQDLYVRDDLLAEQMDDLVENSIVYLSAAHGWKAKDIFTAHGCGGFFAWDGEPDMWQAIATGDAVFRWMLGDNYWTDLDSYEHGAMPLPSSVTDGLLWRVIADSNGIEDDNRPGTYMFDLDDKQRYLPAWCEASFPVSPAGATELTLTVTYSDDTLGVPSQVFSVVAPQTEPLEIQSMLPGEVEIEFAAFDAGGRELDGGSRTTHLLPGKNTLNLRFVPEIYDIIFEPRYGEAHVEPGQWASATITAYLRSYEVDESGNPIPVPGKEVTFTTDIGEFSGPSKVISGDDGGVVVVLQSYKGEYAHVTATVEEDGTDRDTGINFIMDPIYGRTVGEVYRDAEAGSIGARVFIEWDKATDADGNVMPVTEYLVTGSGFNDTAAYGDSYYQEVTVGAWNSPLIETETTCRIGLSSGGGSWDPDAPDQETDQEILQWYYDRFEGAVWEIIPTFE